MRSADADGPGSGGAGGPEAPDADGLVRPQRFRRDSARGQRGAGGGAVRERPPGGGPRGPESPEGRSGPPSRGGERPLRHEQKYLGSMGSRVMAVVVAAVGLIRADGHVLMARRPAGKHLAGYWEFPGGKVEVDETVTEALVREVREELGVDVREEDLVPLTFGTVSEPTKKRDKTFHLLMPTFVCYDWRGEPRGAEGQEVAWCDEATLRALPVPPADVPMIPPFVEVLRAARRGQRAGGAAGAGYTWAAPGAEGAPQPCSAWGGVERKVCELDAALDMALRELLALREAGAAAAVEHTARRVEAMSAAADALVEDTVGAWRADPAGPEAGAEALATLRRIHAMTVAELTVLTQLDVGTVSGFSKLTKGDVEGLQASVHGRLRAIGEHVDAIMAGQAA